MSTRPTSDRLRETLFNVLAPRFPGAASPRPALLDLYAGSGAVGLEALSRGAARVAFVERAEPALRALRDNLAALKILDRYSIHQGSVRAALLRMRAEAGFDVVFLDPPYDAAEEYASTLDLLGGPAKALLSEGAAVVAEHRRKTRLEDSYGDLQRTRLLEQGDAALSFYERRKPE